MRPKYKVTGCARFFIFLIIFVPIVFFGAAYIRGENGVKIIKDFYHKIIGEESKTSTQPTEGGDTLSVEELQRQLKEAQDKIKDLEEDLEARDKEIEKLKSGQE